MALAVFDGAGWPFGPIAKLLLLTGARRDEIAGGRWSEIDLAANRWTIAKERSKNGLAHEIPLSEFGRGNPLSVAPHERQVRRLCVLDHRQDRRLWLLEGEGIDR